MGKLVNIPAVLDTIGCEVTREQKEVIRKDLMVALEAFIDRETGSFNESEKLQNCKQPIMIISIQRCMKTYKYN